MEGDGSKESIVKKAMKAKELEEDKPGYFELSINKSC